MAIKLEGGGGLNGLAISGVFFFCGLPKGARKKNWNKKGLKRILEEENILVEIEKYLEKFQYFWRV